VSFVAGGVAVNLIDTPGHPLPRGPRRTGPSRPRALPDPLDRKEYVLQIVRRVAV
jgi:hypothetical protein